MQKTFIAALLLLVVVLSAALLRTQDRATRLGERLAAVDRVRPSKPDVATTPEEAPVAPAPHPVTTPEPVPKAASKPTTASPVRQPGSQPLGVTFTRSSRVVSPDPNLSEAQQRAISELRKSTESKSQELWERQLALEAETEQAVRRLLDPQQLQAYDAAKAAQSAPSDVQVLLSTPEDPALPTGRRPGYLGITGADAEGGGVQVLQVQSGTVAGLSGLRPGDVILEVNGENVANYGDLAAKMRLNGEGGPVTLRIRRGATEFYQGAQLGPRPP